MLARLRMPFELLLLTWLLAAAAALHATNRWLEARQVAIRSDGDVGVLPDGHVVHVLSLGFERLVADLFWIRTVYYIGDELPSAAGWPAAERLANLVVDTDPHFDSAYVIMASVLSGLRKDPDAAIRLLEKGAQVSKYWRIHFLLGFQYFMEKGDYVHGAQCLERAIALGGPPYMQFLVSRLYANAGDPDTAMQFIALRLKNEETPEIRTQLEKRLSDLWINRDLGRIDAAIGEYKAKFHRDPKDVRALVTSGLLRELPRDPKGGEYAIFSDGKAGTDLPYETLELHMPGLRGQKGK
jgi:tetratricopeptide (TPR) repeat protein